MPFAIKQRMEELGLEQKDLADAAGVTDSYISQLLTRKKAPPAPGRTDIYSRLEKLLKLPNGRLSALAELQRRAEFKRRVMDPPAPFFKELRELILRTCASDKRETIRTILEKQPFGELERLIAQKVMDVVKKIANQELHNEDWLRLFARLSDRSYIDVRVSVLEFLDADFLHALDANCIWFLALLIESWDLDFATFGIEIVLNPRLVPGQPKRFDFVERGPEPLFDVEPGLEEFFDDTSLSGDATQEEVEFLEGLRFMGRRPTALYYYREVQNLRDPLHFQKAPA